MASEDLLAYLKLDAEVYDRYTIHRSRQRNRRSSAIEEVEKRWDQTRSLGEGEFGQVWLELHLSPDRPPEARAVKIVRKEQMRRLQIDYKKELLALTTFSKREYRQVDVLVTFLNWFENDDSIFMAMEYFQYGDLATHMSIINSESEVQQITTDLLEGLKIMHNEKFAHRDLKPQNIFVAGKPPQSQRWRVKIGDFGISKRVKSEQTAWRTQTGTSFFQAPEIHGFIEDDTSEYDNSVDIWSLGCVIYNISAKRVPFLKLSDINSFCRRHLQFPRHPLSDTLSDAGIHFIERLIIPEPARRITINEALQDPWIVNTTSEPPIKHRQVPKTVHEYSEVQSVKIPTSFESNSDEHLYHFNIYDRQKEVETSSATRIQHTSEDNQADRTVVYRTSRPLSSAYTSTVPPHPLTETTRAETVAEIPRMVPQDQHWQTQRQEPMHEASTLSGAFNESAHSVSEPETVPKTQAMSTRIDWERSIMLPSRKRRIVSVAFSPNGTLLASESGVGTVQLWVVATGKVYRKLKGHKSYIRSVAFSPNGTLLALGSYDRTVQLWIVATGKVYCELKGHGRSVFSVAFSPNGTLLASGSGDKIVRLWEVATGEVHCELKGHDGAVLSVTFSPDNTLLASGSYDHTIRLWNVATGQLHRELRGPVDRINSVAFSPNGTLLASGSGDKIVRLWKVATGEVHCELKGHDSYVYSVDFSPDNTLLASGSYDGTIRLWKVATGQLHCKLGDYKGSFLSVAFSPDGTLLASVSNDGIVRLWGAIPSELENKKTPSEVEDRKSS